MHAWMLQIPADRFQPQTPATLLHLRYTRVDVKSTRLVLPTDRAPPWDLGIQLHVLASDTRNPLFNNQEPHDAVNGITPLCQARPTTSSMAQDALLRSRHLASSLTPLSA